MPGFGGAAEAFPWQSPKRQLGDSGHAMIAGLAADGDVRIAKLKENLARKRLPHAFDFLQAEDVRLGLLQKARNKSGTQPDAIDVPGGDFQHEARKSAQIRFGQEKSAQLRRRLGALRFSRCAGREAGAESSGPSARRGGTTDGDWHQPLNDQKIPRLRVGCNAKICDYALDSGESASSVLSSSEFSLRTVYAIVRHYRKFILLAPNCPASARISRRPVRPGAPTMPSSSMRSISDAARL